MKVVISHPTGNAFVRAAAKGLLNEGMLSAFETTVATFPGNVFDRLSSFSLFSEFQRRRYDPGLAPFTNTSPLRELGRIASGKAGLHQLIKHESGIFSVDAVYQQLDKQVAAGLVKAQKKGASAVYAYEDGALFSFSEARRLGLQCLYDLPIGYWRSARQIMGSEKERWPEWASTLTGFGDSAEKLTRKDNELLLSDRIFVASTFTANTLKDFPGKLAPVEIVPYAFPPVADHREYLFKSGGRLKILFVGGLSQRKGIAYLFEAANALSKFVELTVVGQKAINDCPALDKALGMHRWIPSLPHNQILEVMRQHDVLIFPSLFEGFGLVITEAMAQGTPVITTDRTAGPDIIKDNENGWLIEAGSTEALIKAIEKLIHKPDLIAETGQAAMETARQRTWELYGKELSKAMLHNN